MSFTTKLCAVLAFGLYACAQTAQSQTFVTGFNSGAPVRNNYTGFVGMQFTVGAAPISVTSLGRIYVVGNTGTHTVKLINAQTAADVTGGSVQITMSAGTANAFEYLPLAAPVQLQANTSYYLVSQETAGGDQWYDYWPVTTTNAATVNGAVYLDIHGVPQQVGNSAGSSYVPLSFQYTVVSTSTLPAVQINAPAAGAALTSPTQFAATATAGPGLTIASVQFRINNQNFGAPITSAYQGGNLYLLSVGDILSGTYSLTAVATDSANNSSVSLPVQFSFSDITLHPLLTAQTLGPLRNNYGDPYGNFVGFEFMVGNELLTVFELGRYVAPGNKFPHLLKLVTAATGVDVPGGSVTVSTAGATAGQYVYGYLPSPVTLSGNTAYYLLSQETNGGDQWYDFAPVGTSSSLTVSLPGPVYQSDNGAYNLVSNNSGSAYVPVNMAARQGTQPYNITVYLTTQANATYTGSITATAFAQTIQGAVITTVQFQVDGQPFGPPANGYSSAGNYEATLDTTKLTNGAHTLSVVATDSAGVTNTSASQNFTVNNASGTPASPAFVTAFKPTFLRNNYSGFVGMQLTTGSSNVSVSSLGRICVAGNSGTHTVKLVQAPAGTDLAGGSVSISMAGCTAGQFVYAPLASAVTLIASSSYYLASLETSGGDQWYDYSPVTVAAAASVNGAAYFDGAHWNTVPSPSTSYVPVNFLFASAGAPSALTVTATLTSNVVTATTAGGGNIVGVQFLIDGFDIYSQVTAPPYTLTVPSLNYGTHQITAMAYDSLGNVATSSPIEDDVVCGQCFPNNTDNPSHLQPVMTFNGTTLRNNYTGWVGFQFTTAASVSNIGFPDSAIELFCVPGNSQAHIVKLVNAATGLDVPGGTMWVNLATGCGILGQGVVVPSTIFLAGSTTYYLVIQETSGGDRWYDVSPTVTTPFNGSPSLTSIATPFSIDGPVYFNGVKYVLVPSPNYSYVGLLFAGFYDLI